METKKIVMGVISVAVAIIVLMSMIPIFTDAGASEDTFSNIGYYDMTYTTEDEITLSWDRTTPDKVTVNSEVIDLLPPETGKSRTLVCGDDWIVRYWRSGSIFGVEYTPASGSGTSANSSGSNNFSLTASNGSVSVVGATTLTNTYTYLYCIAKDGPLVMKDANESAYMNGDSPIYATGNTANMPAAGITVYLKTSGTIDDGLTTTVFRADGTTDTVTAGTPVLVDSAVSGYVDLYQLDKFTVDVTDGTNTGTVTYSYFIVPAEVTAERSAHVSPVEATLIGLIPLLMMVGIMLTAIGLFIAKYRKN